MEVSYYDNMSYNQAQESVMDMSYYTDSNSKANTTTNTTTNSAANSTGKDILKYMYVNLCICKCQMLIVAFCYVVLLCKSTCIDLSYRFTRDTPTWWCRCRAAKGQTTRDTVTWGWYHSHSRGKTIISNIITKYNTNTQHPTSFSKWFRRTWIWPVAV